MRQCIATLVIGLWGTTFLTGEVIYLRGGAKVDGAIVVEKSDRLFVDLDFTVLSIPREHVLKVERGEVPEEGKGQGAGVRSSQGTGKDLFYVAEGTLPTRSVRELVAELGEAVVQVRTPGGLGSGFFINEEGHLITNFHVIEGETQISIEVYHQRAGQLERTSYKQVRILAMNKFEDLALLKIEDEGAPDFVKVALADPDELSVGERVFAIGSPLGLERTVTEGIVSTKTREFQGELYLQTTAQINPGNSGGPLFNLRGEVVGVTNMKILFSDGIGFAIPVDAVRYFLKHRDAFAYDNDNPSNPYRYLPPPSRQEILGAEKGS